MDDTLITILTMMLILGGFGRAWYRRWLQVSRAGGENGRYVACSARSFADDQRLTIWSPRRLAKLFRFARVHGSSSFSSYPPWQGTKKSQV